MSWETTASRFRISRQRARAEILLCQSASTVHPLGCGSSDSALETSDEELASRIVRLNTLAYLRWQLVQSQEPNRPDRQGRRGIFPSQAQVAAYAELIDFWESRAV